MTQNIPAALDGKRIGITGATGFLGTAIAERLLRCVPGCELILFVRPGRFGAQRRAEREIFRNSAFDKLKSQLGADGFTNCISNRVQVIACDISQDDLGVPAASPDNPSTPKANGNGAPNSETAPASEAQAGLASCDILIHSAAAVAFDNPLDQAVETNLAGPLRLLEALHATGSSPHFVAISTAYVSGSRKGEASEQLIATTPFAVAVDWEAEMESARRLRARVEDDSREPHRLEEFSKEAAKRLGAAGTAALATRREQLRKRWVEKTLIEAGRTRAAALGFADAYTFTKALAEQVLAERRTTADNQIPLTIVRPSIIESALAEPYPGWIRGFRMAEPIIINYAQGLLQDFPAIPESTIDVIPVDLVVAAVCAVAASEPPKEPEVLHVCSGATNPFSFQDLHDWSYDWFVENPVYDDHDQPISPPKWSFPSRTGVAEKLKRAQMTLHATEHVLRMLPVRGKAAEFYAEIEERGEKLDRIAEYVELYGMYVECYATFRTDKLLELWESLSDSDKAEFCFDPRVVDWRTYLTEIHLPSIISTARIKTKPSKKHSFKEMGGARASVMGAGTAEAKAAAGTAAGETARTAAKTPAAELSIMERRRQQILSPDRHLAAFDLENTLLASNVVASWGWLATRRLTRGEQAQIVTRTLLEVPKLLRLDRADRSDFLRYFYRRFTDAPVEQLEEDAWEMFSDLLLAQAFPDAMRRVRQHRSLGHRTMLITGALDFVIEPFRPLFDIIICPTLGSSTPAGSGPSENRRYTGRMSATPPIGENRAQALREYAQAEGLDLSECVAYADSTSDLPMLEVVGFAVAVNPEPKLASLARRRGWLVEHFSKAPGGPRKLLPIAPAASRHTRFAKARTLTSTQPRSRRSALTRGTLSRSTLSRSALARSANK